MSKSNTSAAPKVQNKRSVNPWFLVFMISIIGLIIGYLFQFSFYRPHIGTFLSSDMDSNGSVYILSVNPDDEQYKASKIKNSGHVQFELNLEKSTDKIRNTYRQIEADTKGNFYMVKEERNLDAVVTDDSLYPIIKEAILMYDTNGNYIKEVASADFSDDANPPVSPYIKKLQVIDQKIILVGSKNNIYDVITANPLKDESPIKTKSFEIAPDVEQANKNVEWVNDIAVLSNGRVVYSTKNGNFYAMDNENSFLDYTNIISSRNTLLTGFSVDAADNLYFTDAMSGNFYKMNTKSLSSTNLYKLENEVISGKDIKIKDLRTIKVISEDDYYSPSKSFVDPYYVRFGSNSLLIKNVRGSFIPWGLVIMLSVATLVLIIASFIWFIIHHNIKRIPLAVRITALFLPFFIISMGILMIIIANESANEYVSVLKNDQDLGVKIASEHINGDVFSKINDTHDYMNSDYISAKSNLKDAYNDISSKIGDKSDYIVAYLVDNDKMYSIFSSQYKPESSSYSRLRYTDPDMIMHENTLVDYVLERNEIDTIYKAWESITSESEVIDIVRASFSDVYGDLSASFAPIKNSEGKIIGLIGNFMDENIHRNNRTNNIYRHSASIILIATFIISIYMIVVLKLSLRPIKTLEKSINAMSKGVWNTRVRITSKDEFADIGEAFNLMSEKMDKYTSNLILLNDKYVKFAPTEIFKLIGKSKITQVNLHDYKTTNMNVLYLTFNISCKDSFSFTSEKEFFDALNSSYENFFNVVEKNNGVVHSFGSISATILFPQSAQDAFNASIQFKEIFINDVIKKSMHITLDAGEALIGISGNEKRCGVLVISDQLMQLFNIDKHLKDLKINHVATDEIIKSLPQNGACNYRFIGKVSNIYGDKSVNIYEMIDMANKYKKDLYITTKPLFEKAVKTYIKGDFDEARKLFSDVLKVNNNDSVSINYLMKCEEQTNIQKDGFNKKKWTGNLFD